MQVPPIFKAFWAAYLAELTDPETAAARYYETCRFGHTEENATKTANLVLSGDKIATSALLAEFEIAGKPLPEPGALTIFVDGRGKAAGIIETTEVRIVSFQDVDAQFVFDYGEGDRDLPFWHDAIWKYYVEECFRLGVAASRDMPLVCEYFRLVHPDKSKVVH